jgi:PAS domain S-box-containing protein
MKRLREETARLQKENSELRRSRDIYRGIFDLANDAIFVHNARTGRILDVNASTCEMFEYSRAELLSLDVGDLSEDDPAYSQEEAVRRIREAAEGLGSVFEWRPRKKSGEVFWVEVSLKRAILQGRERIVAIVRDITRRKEAEEILRSSEKRYKMLFESASDGLFVYQLTAQGPPGVFSEVNEAGCRLLGYSCERILQLSSGDLVVPEDVAQLPRVVERLRAEGEAVFEIGLMKENGVPLRAEIHDHFFEIEGRSTVLSIVRDVTERRRLEGEIKDSLREKEILLREIHHRVKNNMQLISSLIDIQSASIEAPELLRTFQETQNRIRAIALVHETLYESTDFSSLNIARYVTGLTGILFGAFAEVSGRVALKLDLEEVPLAVDTVIPCALVITELITNALKHAFPEERPGEIAVSLKRTADGRTCRLVIRDDGIGIPEDVDIRLTKTLGLQLVCGIVERQLRGTLEVRRRPGTEFVITFSEIENG